jgi:hypothetical protein
MPADQAGADDRQHTDYRMMEPHASPTGKNQAKAHQESGLARQVCGKEQEQSRGRVPEPEA